jgi:acyl transferase domain-containing protein/NADPH:quinone reductase-like Zn-dependent oxidoreductase/acyl carrier protein
MNEDQFEPLAIVGIGCVLPGKSDSPSAFWDFLSRGECGITEIPSDRWSKGRFYDSNKGALGKASTHWGAFIEGIRTFDAEFFGISPREAEAMDPQQRMLLTTAWRAFEDAGIAVESLRGSNTSVFVGISGTDYTQIQRFRRTGENMHAGPGGAMSIAANRISHRFDFHGPSVSVDTACSSSLVALSLACETIWKGQSDYALAAGVNALLDPGVFINFSKANMMSPTGRIRTFDAKADGYVRGEGAGVLVIKRLSQAQADLDRVYAVIRSACVNQDGHTTTITAPSADAQTEMLLEACRRAGLRPHDIDVVEAHGTGTPVGDPIEAHAIGHAFGVVRNRWRPLIVGAGKTNTGHLESAAGVTGVIKMALALYKRQIPRNINFKSPNPNIPLDELGLTLPLVHEAWLADSGRPRRGAVNSFGFGGTNACAMLEEVPETARHDIGSHAPKPKTWFLPIGAQTETGLKQVAADLTKTVKAVSEDDAPALLANLAQRRSHMTFRAGVIADGRQSALDALNALAAGKSLKKDAGASVVTGRKLAEPRLVMAFAGQGGAWWGMGRELIANDAVFAQAVNDVDGYFAPLSGWSIAEELRRPEKDYRASTMYSLPCLFGLQVGLLARWKAWGLKPDMVIGHSSGEMAAAYAAGILSLKDTVKIVYHRAALQATQEGRGTIAAIALSRAEVERVLQEHHIGRVDFAGINGPEMVNLAGDRDAIETAVEKLKEKHGQDLFARVLKMEFAPHSHHMDAIMAQFLEGISGISPGPGQTPMISTVTGHMLIGPMADAAYWWRNVRDTVLFDAGLRETVRLGGSAFLELGPHLNLAAMIPPVLSDMGSSAPVVTSLKRGEGADATLAAALATLFTSGVSPNWAALTGGKTRRIDLPHYAFERKPFWLESEESQAALYGEKPHPLLGFRMYAPQPLWSAEFSLDEHKYLGDHLIDGSVIFPAAGYLEMMFAVARDVLGDGAIELENVEILEAMILAAERNEMVQTSFEPTRNRVSIYSRQRGSNLEWTLRARGVARVIPSLAPQKIKHKPPAKSKGALGKDMYKRVAERGYTYGRAFREVKTLWSGETEAYAQLTDSVSPTAGYHFHPGRLDSALHVGFGIERPGAGTGMYLPVRIERLILYKDASNKALASRAQSVGSDERTSIMDIQISEADGAPVLAIHGFTARSLAIGGKQAARNVEKPVFVLEDWVDTELKVAKTDKSARGQRWLVFVTKGANASSEAAAKSLEAAGAHVTRIFSGSQNRQDAENIHTVDVRSPDGFRAIVERTGKALARSRDGLSGVVYGWPADAAASKNPMERASFRNAELQGAIGLMHVVQAMAETKLKPRIWVMTKSALLPKPGQADPSELSGPLANAPVVGMSRTVLTEHPDYRCTVLDLDGNAKLRAQQLKSVAHLFTGGTEETEIALRDEKAFVPRLRMEEASELSPMLAHVGKGAGKRNYRLAMTQAGDIDHLVFKETPNVLPGKGEVSVAIKAGGLNFRDVMAATGLLPADAEEGVAIESLGLEASGVVEAVGPGVKGIKPGDRVMTTAKGCFRGIAVVAASQVQKLPPKLSFIDAATVPSAFATAYFALSRLARVRKGETVLVHLGTGGVGLAAIQIARMFGAKVISTAGSEDKRAYLRKFGIEHVFDSRALDFAEGVRAATNGRGVDVILNALAGDAIPIGVGALAANGRFIEIGKRDIYSDSALGLRALRRNASFFALDMARMDQDDPIALAEVYAEMLACFASGRLKPLPAMVFKSSQVVDAFKAMARAKHIGKVVIDFEDPALKIGVSLDMQLALDPNGAYVVTGGLGGFGAEVAKFLASRGAKHLYLMGRSGASRPEAKQVLADLGKIGAKAHVVTADVTDPSAAMALVAQIAKDKRPLKGVFHSAMVLDDAFIAKLDAGRMLQVMEPKILGAWNLHMATSKLALDHFVTFSSMASIIGSSGQANYVAANRYLDLLAEHRQAAGLPARTINWGALGGAGAVQRNKAILKYLKTLGMPPLSLDEALKGLEVSMLTSAPVAGYCKIDWQSVARANAGLTGIPRYSDVVSSGPKASGGGRIRVDLLAAKGADRDAMLKDYIAKQIARVLKIDAKAIQPARPLSELGLDSLTSFQLKNKIESDVGITLPVGRFLQKPTIESLSTVIGQVLETSATNTRKGGGAEAGSASVAVLSPRQEWLWKRIQTDGAFPAHGMMELMYALEVGFPVDPVKLNEAFAAVVKKFENLRNNFPAEGARPTVAVLPVDRFRVNVVDASAESASQFDARLAALANAPHDLKSDALLDVHLFARPDGKSVIVLRSHVILTDGWSFGTVLRELFQAYFGLGQAEPSSNANAPDFQTYAREQRARFVGADGKKAHTFWKEKLRDLPPPLQIGQKDAAKIDPLAGGGYVKRYVSADHGVDVRGAARKLGVSIHALMAAAVHVQLFQKTGTRDIVLVSNVANRNSLTEERLVGWLANHLLLRCAVDPTDSFKTHVEKTAAAFQEPIEFAGYPAHMVLEAANESNERPVSPHFVGLSMMWPDNAERSGFEKVMFAPAGTPHRFGGLELKMLPAGPASVGHFLNNAAITYQEVDGELLLSLHFRDQLFAPGQERAFLDGYLDALRICLRDPGLLIGDIAGEIAKAPGFGD